MGELYDCAGGEMSDPTVTCVMLTRDRPAMARRAIRSFQQQTYSKRVLVILDTSEKVFDFAGIDDAKIRAAWSGFERDIGHGRLCNSVNNMACPSNIICHWDDDDWSHPDRISQQVKLLQSSDVDCVGYNEMLFWDETPGHSSASWLYSSHTPTYCMGTSMMYWRRSWELQPFPALTKGSDTIWQAGLKRKSVSAVQTEPMMIASVHGGNVASRIIPPKPQQPGRGPIINCWQRAPEWDARCREVMVLR